LVEDGIPAAAFSVDDATREYERLIEAGVTSVQAPTDVGSAIIAVFDDQSGNLIQIVETSE
jgi:predicted enzyme related to lactoylglutathione lyase